jgi:hypothetical protein
MISEADVQKLRAIHAHGPSVLSLYVWLPVDLPVLRELPARAEPVVANWVTQREQELVSQILTEPPDGLTVTGLSSCLAAVNQHAVNLLVLPVGGLIPGFACQVCGTLACAPGGCPHQPPAVRPVPDLLEEMAAATLDDGGEVAAVADPPGDVAARLRFPLAPVPGA